MTTSRPQMPLWRTYFLLLWEWGYAAAMPFVALILAFLGISLMGAWAQLPMAVHIAALAGLALAVVLLWRRLAVLGPLPTVADARARLERDNALPTGTFADLADEPVGGDAENPLWRAHQAQLLQKLRGLKAQRPRALIDRTDPFAGRVAGVLIFGVGLLIAGENWGPRLAAGFVPQPAATAPLRADIWLAPPDYTGEAPRFLVRAGTLPAGTAETITVPSGSVLNLRLNAPGTSGRPPNARARLATPDGQQDVPLDAAGRTLTASLPITENSAFELRTRGNRAIWPIAVQEDRAPDVRWETQPSAVGGTRTFISAVTEDDYGITEATLKLKLATPLDRPPDAPRAARDVVGETLSVPLPGLQGAGGMRETEVDLTEHPWAGMPVEMRLEVADGSGQTAASGPVRFVLPTRLFYNPLSRAVIEERRSLALAPSQWRRSARLFDAMTFAPEQFAENTRDYLLLRTAYHEMAVGRGKNVDELVESFWSLAIALEDEGLTLARQRLEAAQEALRKALANGAPPEEIDRLVEALRQAMADYVAALAASGDAQASQEQTDQELSERDLDDILDEIARLRRQGDTAEAQARLAELEALLQNLTISQGQSGQSGQGNQSGSGQGAENDGSGEGEGTGSALDSAGSLIDQQRRLSDDTFSARRGDRSTEGLSQGQRALAEGARALADQATAPDPSGSAGDPSTESAREDAARAFGNAESAMEMAADALSRGELQSAQALQEQAITALRRGAETLAEAALAERGERDGGDGERGGQQTGEGTRGAERDPLGRLWGQQGPTDIDIPDLLNPEQIRTLTEELRRRLSNPDLTDAERAYLERLLRRF